MGGSISKQDFILPFPRVPNVLTGVSISQSEGCTSGDCSSCQPNQDKNECCSKCQLIVPANVSSSAVTLTLPTEGNFSAKTKLFIKPTIPFEVTFNGKSETFNTLTLFQPSPVRIENVQHDAVLTLGNPGDNNLVILIPLISSPQTTDASNFVGKIVQYASSIIGTETKTIDASTGADWNLTKIIPVGQNSIASGSFFTWNSSTYELKVVGETAFTRFLQWTPTAGPQYILMGEPVNIKPVDLEVLRRLPITNPTDSIHSMGVVSYKNAPPKDCVNCLKPSLAALQEMVFEKKGYEGLSAGTVTSILIGVAAFIVGLYAISIGLKWALDSYKGSIFERWSDALVKQFRKTTQEFPEEEPQLS